VTGRGRAALYVLLGLFLGSLLGAPVIAQALSPESYGLEATNARMAWGGAGISLPMQKYEIALWLIFLILYPKRRAEFPYLLTVAVAPYACVFAAHAVGQGVQDWHWIGRCWYIWMCLCLPLALWAIGETTYPHPVCARLAGGLRRSITGIAIALSLAAFLQRMWRPYDATLGRVPGRHGYHDVARHPDAQQIPGLIIFRFDAPVFFANAEHFARCVKKHIAERGEPVRHVVIAGEPITDIDTTGAESLRDLIDDLAEGHVTLAFAEIKGPVKDRLRSYGAYRDIGRENFYSTIGHAVTEYLEEAGGEALEWVDDYDGPVTTPKG